MQEDSTSTPARSETVAATATTDSLNTATITSASSANGHLATAVAVDDRTVVVADPVEGSEAKETPDQGTRKEGRFFAVVGIVVLVVITIALSVGLTQRGTTIDTNSAGSDSAASPNEGGTAKPGFSEDENEELYYERWNDMVAILGPMYEGFEGGVEVFNRTSPFASDDRINALKWLVVQDKVPIPTPPGNTSALDSGDQEKYEQLAYKVRQRYVLALLYMATNGKFWYLQYNFLLPFDECQWDSVYDPETDERREEFRSKGVICNDQGQVEKLSMWWNGMSGTLPHELSLFSDSLKEINTSGGSMSGTIPSSLTKLTNMETFVINDNCFSGDLPEEMNPIDLPKLAILAIHMNNYGIASTKLGEFCDGSGGRIAGVIALAADCPAEEFLDDNNGNLTLAETAPYDCDCCICCYPEQYQCQDLVSGGSWTSYFLNDFSPEGYPQGFATKCVSEEQESWIAENCPCLINATTDPLVNPFDGECTTDCSQEGAIPSYDFGA